MARHGSGDAQAIREYQDDGEAQPPESGEGVAARVVDEFESLLVIREWPGGEVTAYTASTRGGADSGKG